jgi:ComF family protein
VRPIFRQFLDPLFSLIFPHNCGACGRLVERLADGPACSDCWAQTHIFSPDDTLCQKCGAFLEGAARSPVANNTCGTCTDHYYDTARAAGMYERALHAEVLFMKKEPALSRTARQYLIETLQSFSFSSTTVVIPVPLSKQRAVERGFNQAEVLARAVGRHAGLSVDAYSLTRTLDTPMHRAAMDKKAREATVRNAFRVMRPSLLSGIDILLVDDLMTSGSTVSQCAKALKKNGAGRVDVLTLARAV